MQHLEENWKSKQQLSDLSRSALVSNNSSDDSPDKVKWIKANIFCRLSLTELEI